MRNVAYILLIVFSWQIIAKGTVLISYKLNQSYIASQLCEQKAIKNNTCNGKCYLRKQLQKQDNPATQDTPNLKDKYEVSVYVIYDLLRLPLWDPYLPKHYQACDDVLYVFDHKGKIFHPPQII